MRAGRLVSLLLLLQRGGRHTARDLAVELEVSERTVLRDLEQLSGAGVPVYAVRGRNGGFELLEGWSTELPGPGEWSPGLRRPGTARRAQVRVSPDGHRLAAVLGRLQPLRVRGAPDAGGWQRASFRMGSLEATAREVMSVGPDIEVLEPAVLRRRVAELAARVADLHE